MASDLTTELDAQICSLHDVPNPLHATAISSGTSARPATGTGCPGEVVSAVVTTQVCTPQSSRLVVSGELASILDTSSITPLELASIITDTVLDVASVPMTIVRYMLCLEYVFIHRRDIDFLTKHVYTPIAAERTIQQIDMNLAFLDMCTAVEFAGTPLQTIQPSEVMSRVERLVQVTVQASNIVRMMRSFGSVQETVVRTAPAASDLERELKPQQKLLDFLFQRAGEQRLRRKGTALYRPRTLEDNTHTGFYEYFCEVNDFVFRQVTPARLYPEYYDALTNRPTTPSQMIALLSSVPDPRCPFLTKNRSLFSFRNGIFDARAGTFSEYANGIARADGTSQYFDWAVDRDTLTMDAKDIPTPYFEKILDDQDMNEKAKMWLYALCGRLLHDVGTLDDWQVTLYIRGVAGSGKSTILKVMGMMYEALDIGYMMSDGQTTFSDEHLYDKHIVMAMDIDRKTLFSSTRINSITSGEQLSVNRKFKTALNIRWKPPLIMASNSQPPWDDVAGNLVRRFVIFLFNNPIRDSDPHLFDKLRVELPLLLIKMSRMYLDAVEKYGGKSLWDNGVLPTMCHDAKRQYLVSSNPLSAFLSSDHVLFNPHFEVPAAEVRKAVLQYMRDNGDRRRSVGVISAVDHGHIFGMYKCRLDERKTGTSARLYIVGMTLADAVDNK